MFDTPIAKPIAEEPIENENQILFELTNETRDIKVNQPVHVVPITEVNQSGVVKYSLEHYMELEEQLTTSKPVAIAEEPIDHELNLTVSKQESKPNFEPDFAQNASPMEMSFEDTMKIVTDERRKKLKDLNHIFHNTRVDELEKIPAYKRSGIDLANEPTSNQNSRISLGTDSNNDNQLRSNNSYLHDSVD